MPKTLATATVDRLLHHAHVCVTSGDSVRLAQATAGQGVVPLTARPGATPPAVPRRPERTTGTTGTGTSGTRTLEATGHG
jgi:IstB-like ATP binding protein